jgi:mRNA interferase HicA
VKQVDLIRHLERCGCEFLREGGNHAVYVNRSARKSSSVPRHRDVNYFLARKICAPNPSIFAMVDRPPRRWHSQKATLQPASTSTVSAFCAQVAFAPVVSRLVASGLNRVGQRSRQPNANLLGLKDLNAGRGGFRKFTAAFRVVFDRLLPARSIPLGSLLVLLLTLRGLLLALLLGGDCRSGRCGGGSFTVQ